MHAPVLFHAVCASWADRSLHSLQVHYDNVDRDSGKVDSSGFRFYYTSTLRDHDAAVLQIGDPNVRAAFFSSAIPPGSSKFTIVNQADECTNSFSDDEITVFTR